MPDNVTSSTHIGLSEFLSGIISDTLDSILMARQQQESRYEDLLAAAQLPPQEFARLIPDEAVEAELERVFPTQEPNRSHSIYVNAPYTPSVGSQVESPPILDRLGIRLRIEAANQPSNARAQLGVGGLTQQHVDAIYAAVRGMVAARQQAKISSLVQGTRVGVIVDSGRLTAKVGLRLVPNASIQQRTKSESQGEPPNAVSAFLRQPKEFRVELQMVDATAPQNREISVDLHSEIEITFKTITT